MPKILIPASSPEDWNPFRADDAAMIVHSFSHTNEWFEDYQALLDLFGLRAGVDQAVSTSLPTGLPLHFAWVHGTERYLRD